MCFKKAVATTVAKKAVKYLSENPEENFPKLMALGKKLTKNGLPFYARVIKQFEDMWGDQKSPWHDYFVKYLTWLEPKEREKIITNFFINADIFGYQKQVKLSKKYGCNIPWTILIDPTSACNLKCKGCWAAEYSKQNNLSYEDIDRVIKEANKLGDYFFLFSGGEPLVRKDDIIKLCTAHNNCMFAAFTNATLIDEKFCEDLARVGNFIPVISIEGFESATDFRRGEGTFNKVVAAMDLLKKHHLAFGFSCCYTSKNISDVASEEFIDFLIEKGAWFGWYFTFIPVGKDAPTELMVNAEQREYMYHRVREIRVKKPIFVLDFWNDGEYVEGCVAGGRRYFHINANGDAEPCAFIHYSNTNIHKSSVLDIMKSPLFMAYHNGQPFNSNHLRPCPLLDNPEKLRDLVHTSGAVSTQPLDSEDVNDLTAKCEGTAEEWSERADYLWHEHCKVCKSKVHCKVCTYELEKKAEAEKSQEKETTKV